MAFAAATYVSACVKTSSFLLTLHAISAKCKADVPLIVATAYFAPVNFLIMSSNLFTKLPAEDTKVESIHSFKYFFSLPINLGTCKGIISELL